MNRGSGFFAHIEIKFLIFYLSNFCIFFIHQILAFFLSNSWISYLSNWYFIIYQDSHTWIFFSLLKYSEYWSSGLFLFRCLAFSTQNLSWFSLIRFLNPAQPVSISHNIKMKERAFYLFTTLKQNVTAKGAQKQEKFPYLVCNRLSDS